MPNMKKAFKVLGIYDDLRRSMSEDQIDALAEMPYAQAKDILMAMLDGGDIDTTEAVIDKVLGDQGLR